MFSYNIKQGLINFVMFSKHGSLLGMQKFNPNLFFTLKLTGTTLTDVTAADFPYKKKRLHLIYNFKTQNNLFIKTQLTTNKITESASQHYTSATVLEREVFEFFSILFNNNNDLRKLLLDYSFIGNPLLKDFPLPGYNQVSFSSSKVLVFKNLALSQDLRVFSFNQVWIK